MYSTIPTKPEEISKEWVQHILGESVTVEDVIVSSATEKGQNFTVQVVRCQVKGLKGDKPYETSLIMKIMPFLEWQRELVKKLRIFIREVAAYKDIFQDMMKFQTQDAKLELSIPKCFYTTLEDARGIIVLEDLAPDGYRLQDFRVGQDVNHCKLTLDELAKFHALGFNVKYKSSRSLPELYPENTSNPDGPAKGLYVSAFKNAIENAREYFASVPGKEKAVELLNQEDMLIEKYFQSYAIEEPFATLCHGDFWNNNMLFKFEEATGKPVNVKLVDFQMVTYGCPASDLMYFFTISASPKVKRDHFTELLQHYYDRLFEYLEILGVNELTKKSFSFEDLRDRYFQKNGIRGLLMGFHIIPTLFVPKEDAIDSKDDTVKSSESFVDKVKEMGKEAAKHNVEVQERISYLIEEMLEHGAF